MATILSKLRVLLVDDEPIMRKLAMELLRQIGIHQIHEATDGKGALVEAIKFQPDLVLSDIHMEPMDGIEFVKKLRALPNPHFAHIPVILMTADTSKETLTEALPLGIKGYMIKPPTLEAMKAKIKAAVN
jgi:CheY-like chemotaxis protein